MTSQVNDNSPCLMSLTFLVIYRVVGAFARKRSSLPMGGKARIRCLALRPPKTQSLVGFAINKVGVSG